MRLAALLALPALALLLLAAHLFHAGAMPLAALAILLAGLLAVPRPWAARTLQVVLAVAVIEWILTTVGLAQLRLRHDEPYARLASDPRIRHAVHCRRGRRVPAPRAAAYFGLSPKPGAGSATS